MLVSVPPPSILLVDDDRSMRMRVRELLCEGIPGVAIGEAGSAEQCLAQVSAVGWDLVLLDIHMPGSAGLDLLRTLRAAPSELVVVMLSALPPDPYAAAARRAGASAYVSKQRIPEDLVATVVAVLSARRRATVRREEP